MKWSEKLAEDIKIAKEEAELWLFADDLTTQKTVEVTNLNKWIYKSIHKTTADGEG